MPHVDLTPAPWLLERTDRPEDTYPPNMSTWRASNGPAVRHISVMNAVAPERKWAAAYLDLMRRLAAEPGQQYRPLALPPPEKPK